MSDAKILARLYEAMAEHGFHELDLKAGSWSCHLVVDPQVVAAGSPEGPGAETAAPSQEPGGPLEDWKVEEGTEVMPIRVVAERVGVFRFGKHPLAPGMKVTANQVLGTLKGISVQDQVTAPRSGTILTVDIKDGEIAEFGRLLFTLEPAPEEGK